MSKYGHCGVCDGTGDYGRGFPQNRHSKVPAPGSCTTCDGTGRRFHVREDSEASGYNPNDGVPNAGGQVVLVGVIIVFTITARSCGWFESTAPVKTYQSSSSNETAPPQAPPRSAPVSSRYSYAENNATKASNGQRPLTTSAPVPSASDSEQGKKLSAQDSAANVSSSDGINASVKHTTDEGKILPYSRPSQLIATSPSNDLGVDVNAVIAYMEETFPRATGGPKTADEKVFFSYNLASDSVAGGASDSIYSVTVSANRDGKITRMVFTINGAAPPPEIHGDDLLRLVAALFPKTISQDFSSAKELTIDRSSSGEIYKATLSDTFRYTLKWNSEAPQFVLTVSPNGT